MRVLGWIATGLKWLCIGSGVMTGIAGAIGLVVLFVYEPGAPSDAARPAVEALDDDSVYVDPAVADTVDADAARRVIGDRSIVVAVFPADHQKRAGAHCEDIVWRRSLAIGLVYAGSTAPAICGGRYAESPAGLGADEWGRQIQLADDLARLRGDAPEDLNARIAGFVSAYDLAVNADLYYGRPPRVVEDRTGSWGDVVAVLVAIAVGVLILFLGLMAFGGRISEFWQDRRRRRVEHAEVRAEFSAVAAALGSVDRSGSPEAFAEAVRAYADAQDVYRRARTPNYHLWARASLRRALAAIDEARAAAVGSQKEGIER